MSVVLARSALLARVHRRFAAQAFSTMLRGSPFAAGVHQEPSRAKLAGRRAVLAHAGSTAQKPPQCRCHVRRAPMELPMGYTTGRSAPPHPKASSLVLGAPHQSGAPWDHLQAAVGRPRARRASRARMLTAQAASCVPCAHLAIGAQLICRSRAQKTRTTHILLCT